MRGWQGGLLTSGEGGRVGGGGKGRRKGVVQVSKGTVCST